MRGIGLLSISFLVTACTGESVLEKQENVIPTILIASHSDGVEVQDGYLESFRASVSDDDNTYDELQIAWYVGTDIVCDWAGASPSGDSFCDIVFSPGDSNVIAEVRDPVGAGGRAEISVSVLPTEAPTAAILTPLSGSNYYSNQLIQFSGVIGDNEDALEDLLISWSSSLDGELPLDTAPDSSGEISDYAYLTEGQHAIELRVEDSSGKITTDEVVLLVGGENTIPQCGITSPSNMETYIQGEMITFTGTATDDDIPSNELEVIWTSDKDGVFGTQNPTSGGSVNLAYDGLSTSTHTITMSVEDDTGSLCSAEIFLVIGTPPTISIDDPTNDDLYSVGESIVFRGTVSDTEDQSNALQVIWVSSLDGEIYNSPANSQGVSQFSSSTLSSGLHSISASVSDSSGLLADDLITIRVNTPPTAPTISFNPNPVYSTDSLTASVSGSIDEDGDNIFFVYEWYENAILTSYTGAAIPASELDVGEIWSVRVTPNDGYIDGNYTEETITISNSEPILSAISISQSNNIYNDSTLTCLATASDADQSITPSFSWEVNGTIVQSATINLANITSLPSDIATCTVTATDSHGASSSGTASITIENREPIISNQTIIPASVYSSDTVTCSATITEPDGENYTESYEWFVNGSSLGTGSSLSLNQQALPSENLDCVLTVTDDTGATIESTASVLIQNTPPTIDSSGITPAEPNVHDIVTCTATASDIDLETPSLLFSFYDSNGTTYIATSSTTSSATLDLSTTGITPNTDLICTIAASDGHNGSTMTTETVTVINSAPTFDVPASITPNTGVVHGTELTCSANAVDATDPNVSLTYDWIVGGLTVAANTTTYTVDINTIQIGQTIECFVTATDNDGETATDSDSVVFENTAPSLTTPVVSSSLSGVYNDAVLTCSSTVTDLEETLTASYGWTLNGSTPLAFNNTIDLSTYSIMVGDSLTCEAMITDSYGAYASDTTIVSVANRDPDIPSLTITSNPVDTVDDIVCSVSSASTDADGEALNFSFSWTQNGSTFTTASTTATSSTISVGNISVGETWICSVTATDGHVTTTPAIATAIVVPPFSDVTFNNCGQTGETGPSQSSCDSEYFGTDLEGDVTVTNGLQYWVVPFSGTYSIEAYGAEGGVSNGEGGGQNFSGGLGAYMYGEFSLTGGDTLVVLVGQQGENGNCGSGGGGGTFVHNASQLLIVAGGGGGGFHCYALGGRYGGDGQTSETSGSGVCSPQRPTSSGVSGGQGGSSTHYGSGGSGYYSGGSGSCAMSAYPANGGSSLGGFGGGGCRYSGCCGNSGAGGGYSGGSVGSSDGCAGGGGGSYNAGSNTNGTAGFNSSHGSVIVSLISMN